MSCNGEVARPLAQVESCREATQQPTNCPSVWKESDHVAGAIVNAEWLAEHLEHAIEPLDDRRNS